MVSHPPVILQGSSLGLSSCVYVTDGQYTPYQGSKVFWLIFWAVQASWMALFPGFVAKATFGESRKRQTAAAAGLRSRAPPPLAPQGPA